MSWRGWVAMVVSATVPLVASSNTTTISPPPPLLASSSITTTTTTTTTTPLTARLAPCSPRETSPRETGTVEYDPRKGSTQQGSSGYFMHQPLSYDDLLDWMTASGASEKPDDIFDAENAALMVDVPLLKAFRAHPSRCYDEWKAWMHVIDYPFFASDLSMKLRGATGNNVSSTFDAIFAAMKDPIRHHWTLPWVIINADWRTMWLDEFPHLTSLVEFLKSMPPKTIFVTVDPAFVPVDDAPYVLVPYVAHHAIERLALEKGNRTCTKWHQRRTSVMSRGSADITSFLSFVGFLFSVCVGRSKIVIFPRRFFLSNFFFYRFFIFLV